MVYPSLAKYAVASASLFIDLNSACFSSGQENTSYIISFWVVNFFSGLSLGTLEATGLYAL